MRIVADGLVEILDGPLILFLPSIGQPPLVEQRLPPLLRRQLNRPVIIGDGLPIILQRRQGVGQPSLGVGGGVEVGIERFVRRRALRYANATQDAVAGLRFSVALRYAIATQDAVACLRFSIALRYQGAVLYAFEDAVASLRFSVALRYQGAVLYAFEDAVEIPNGSAWVALAEISLAQVEVGDAVVGVELDGPVEIIDGPLELALLDVGQTSLAIIGRCLGFEGDGPVEIGDGLGQVLLLHMDRRPPLKSVGVSRAQLDGPVEVGDGRVQVTLIGIGQTAIVMGHRVGGVQRERLVVILDSPLVIALASEGQAPIAVGRAVLRVETEGLAEIIDGLTIPFQFSLSQPPRVVEHRPLPPPGPLLLKHLAEIGGGLLVMARLEMGQAPVNPQRGIIGPNLETAFVDRQRLVRLPRRPVAVAPPIVGHHPLPLGQVFTGGDFLEDGL